MSSGRLYRLYIQPLKTEWHWVNQAIYYYLQHALMCTVWFAETFILIPVAYLTFPSAFNLNVPKAVLLRFKCYGNILIDTRYLCSICELTTHMPLTSWKLEEKCLRQPRNSRHLASLASSSSFSSSNKELLNLVRKDNKTTPCEHTHTGRAIYIYVHNCVDTTTLRSFSSVRNKFRLFFIYPLSTSRVFKLEQFLIVRWTRWEVFCELDVIIRSRSYFIKMSSPTETTKM